MPHTPSSLSPESKRAFIELALNAGVLKFGEFKLKSGRLSPYFFNAGLFYEGQALKELGEFYAEALLQQSVDFKHLFGPAYKGLPLATATAIALADKGLYKTVTFNRKEIKDHGEGGAIIGAPLTDGNCVMIDDVITAGTAFRESQIFIKAHGGTLRAVIIAFNRCERGLGKTSTLAEIEASGIQVISLISFYDLIDFLEKSGDKTAELERMWAYHREYGG